YDGHFVGTKSVFYIVSRSAAERVAIFHFIYLSESAFYKTGRSADESNNPHPKHSAGPACCNRQGDTSHIACSHSGCCTNRPSLKSGYAFSFCINLIFNDPEHFAK